MSVCLLYIELSRGLFIVRISCCSYGRVLVAGFLLSSSARATHSAPKGAKESTEEASKWGPFATG